MTSLSPATAPFVGAFGAPGPAAGLPAESVAAAVPSVPSLLALAAVGSLFLAGVWLSVPSGRDRLWAVRALRGSESRLVPRLGYVSWWAALVGSLAASISGVLPPSAAVVVTVSTVALALSARVVRERSPTSLRVGAVIAAAALCAVTVLTPLSGVPLPDITALGGYTYLATEVVFGAFALALLVRAGRDALRSAGVTVAAVYPLAYVWDWYTLTVGVFEIPLRTGHEFAGIPIEEHLFMVVVPALVLGVHETIRAHNRD